MEALGPFKERMPLAKKVVVLDGKSLRIEDIVKVARDRYTVEFSKESEKNIQKGQEIVEELVNKGEAIYGVTTGIGEFSRIRVSKEQSDLLQKNIVYSHAAGVGNIVAPEVIRAAMLCRANVMAQGITGVRLETAKTYIEMINRDVVPIVYEKGSVGTSGDLSPMSQIAEVAIGEGEAFYKGKRMPGGEAMKAAGLKPIVLSYKEGLGLINGSQMVTGLAGLLIYDAFRLFKVGQVASSMTIDALKGVMKAFDPRLHAVRPFKGQNLVAANMRKVMADSEILADKSGKVQDGYSMRCTPQVLGPVKDMLDYAREQVEIEMNSGIDNPIFLLEERCCLTGGNFHAQPIAAVLDFLGIVFTFAGGLSERHTNRLMNPVLSNLPDFLVEGKGVNSGLMVAQYTAAALVSECKIFAHPACVDSISLSADQEDYVSMAPGAAFKFREILRNYVNIIAIEMMAAAQAFDFRAPKRPGKGSDAAYKEIRKLVTHLDKDRVLYPDIHKIAKLVEDGTILTAVEKAIGELQ
jgi:histidine ammonia-lyase